ncbi:hypothetical protein GF325_00240 [Candidatus Bathyarchaeota archaeon]|nr:hypothetical protein [Candidatus Bathyarchaeota archaeon]
MPFSPFKDPSLGHVMALDGTGNQSKSSTSHPSLQVKVVYWGPAEVGKTTSLVHVYNSLHEHAADALIKVQTTGGRTLWSEYGALEFEIPSTRGPVSTVVHVSAVTGQERFLNTREFTAASADGIMFVADSRRHRLDATKRSYEELLAYMPRTTPIMVQANFQDARDVLSPAMMHQVLLNVDSSRPPINTVFTVAKDGVNTVGAFLQLLCMVITKMASSNMGSESHDP